MESVACACDWLLPLTRQLSRNSRQKAALHGQTNMREIDTYEQDAIRVVRYFYRDLPLLRHSQIHGNDVKNIHPLTTKLLSLSKLSYVS